MSEPHIDDIVFGRLLRGQGGPPLAASEFNDLHRHLDRCAACRARFTDEQARARGTDALSAAQVETILRVVRENATAAAAGRVRWPGEQRALWRRPLGWALGVGLALSAALVLPIERRSSEFHPRGEPGRPSRSPVCFDERTATEEPIGDPLGYCREGWRAAVHARELQGLPYVSVVACTSKDGAWTCALTQPSAQADPSDPVVDASGPAMQVGARWRIFTVWSKDPITSDDVNAATDRLRTRGGRPDDTNELPFGRTTRQLAHTVVAGEKPPS